MSVLSFLILCVLEATVLLTAYIYDTQIFAEMDNIFRVIWVMVLVLANWLASTVIFFKNKNITKSPDFGVVPAINISVFIWSILSVLAMVFLADFSMRTHMIVQVILRFLLPDTPAGITTVLIVILFIGSMQLLGISILGEYIGKIFEDIAHPKCFCCLQVVL